MTLYAALTEFWGTMAAACVFGFICGALVIWIPRNVK
jgi:hypothetical protein